MPFRCRKMDAMKKLLFMALFSAMALHAELVPNQSLIKGGAQPEGWVAPGEFGSVVKGRMDEAAIAIRPDGAEGHAWLSDPLPLKPGGVYYLSFWAKSMDPIAEGTAVTGTDFCNVDIGCPPESWTRYSYVFAAPADITGRGPRLRFGEWHTKARICFDDFSLQELQPVYGQFDGIELGAGEKIHMNEYSFTFEPEGPARNHCRALVGHMAGFNTNRWVLGQGAWIEYGHHVNGRRQLAARLMVNVGYHVGGTLRVMVSKDETNWREVGSLNGTGACNVTLPADLFPADRMYVKLMAESNQERDGKTADPGSFQVGVYRYEATLEGGPLSLTGETNYMAMENNTPDLDVKILRLGDCLPFGENVMQLELFTKGKALSVEPDLSVLMDEGTAREFKAERIQVAEQPCRVTIPYEVTDVGRGTLRLVLGGDAAVKAEKFFEVPPSFSSDYGECLEGDADSAELWWASSAWKIHRNRGLPKAVGRAVKLAAARNEAEAVQLVLRPKANLSNVKIEATALQGPAGAVIPSESVEFLMVKYLNISRPTDSSTVAGLWADPLPAIVGPFSAEANVNQPLWIRVKVPKGVPGGLYNGTVRLQADGGWQADVPLQLEVYGFDFPDKVSCVTSFGLDYWRIFQYHGLKTDPQKRLVIDKPLKNFDEHHISPTSITPFAEIGLSLENTTWLYGVQDTTVAHGGNASCRVTDNSTSEHFNMKTAKIIPAGKRYRLRFWHRSDKPDHRILLTRQHCDGKGNWMSGRNKDIPIDSGTDWRFYEETFAEYPQDAASFSLCIWATLWTNDGALTGTVWVDDLELVDLETGETLSASSDFEQEMDKPELAIDWKAWDEEMEAVFSRYHFTSFCIPIVGLGGGTYYSHNEPFFMGFPESSPHYDRLHGDYLRRLNAHLKEKGWADMSYSYWFDEPDPKDYPFVLNGFLKLKKNAPDIGRMLTEQFETGLEGGPNIWCPLTTCVDKETVAERTKRGETFWWYICCTPKAPFVTEFIDHPGTESRVWLWQTWDYGVKGILIWTSNYWTSYTAYPDENNPQNPYEDPMSWTCGYGTPAGTKSPWGNGDGRYIYPPEVCADGNPKEPCLDGPVDSIRWELLRDGIEDYEYFVMLRRLIAENGNWVTDAQRIEYEELMKVPEGISSSLTKFTFSPEPMERHRERLARAIETLTKN